MVMAILIGECPSPCSYDVPHWCLSEGIQRLVMKSYKGKMGRIGYKRLRKEMGVRGWQLRRY